MLFTQAVHCVSSPSQLLSSSSFERLAAHSLCSLFQLSLTLSFFSLPNIWRTFCMENESPLIKKVLLLTSLAVFHLALPPLLLSPRTAHKILNCLAWTGLCAQKQHRSFLLSPWYTSSSPGASTSSFPAPLPTLCSNSQLLHLLLRLFLKRCLQASRKRCQHLSKQTRPSQSHFKARL